MNRWLLGLLLSVLPLASMAGANPFLLTILPHSSTSTQPKSYVPISVDEGVALRAASLGGGMWVPLPAGGLVYLNYYKSIIHNDGTWTWVGTLSDVQNAPKAFITFGDHAVFGTIPTSSGHLFVLATLRGQAWLADSRDTLTATQAPRLGVLRSPGTTMQADRVFPLAAAAASPSKATPDNPATVDLLVVYTSEFVAQFGSLSAAITFIEHEVDETNQAFSDSQVYGQIRLIKTAQTTIPDSLDPSYALQELPTNATVTALRNGYGADVVVMADSTRGGACRGAFLQLGSNLTPIPPGPSGPAYLVWGEDGTGPCDGGRPDYSLALMLGSTFGLAQEPSLPSYLGGPGAYTFSYAYQKPGTSKPSQGTLEVSGIVIWPYFSNPNINLCDGPCGVPDQSDAARSLNLTLPIVATFAPTKDARFDDVDGDGKSDLKWYSSSGGQYGGGQFAYWIMNGQQLTSSKAFSLYYGLTPLASGDFNGDGYMDVIWKETASNGVFLHMWTGYGTSFSDVYMRPYPIGWTLVGTGDIDGDGKTDLVWSNGNKIAEWLMDGTGFTSYWQTLPDGWQYIGIGDFDDDLKEDLLLTNGSVMQMWTAFNNGSFTRVATHAYPVGWSLLGAGDVNGDGMADLLWRDNSRTHFAYWVMSGTQLVKSWLVAVTPEWKLGTSGDFNGDGLLDLVWYNGSQIVMWPGKTTGIYKGVIVHGYPTGGWMMLQ